MVCMWEHVNWDNISQSKRQRFLLLMHLHQTEHVSHHLPVFRLAGDVNQGGEERERAKVFHHLSANSTPPWIHHRHNLRPSRAHLPYQRWHNSSNISSYKPAIFQPICSRILESQRCVCDINPNAFPVIGSQV